MASKKDKAAPTHPPYVDMVKEALVTLKERNGSSQQALKKFIGGKYKLPQGWEKTLSTQLKRLVEDGKLVRVKASYKLGEPLKKAPAKAKKPATKKAVTSVEAKPAAKPKAKKPAAKKAAAKPKKVAAPKKAKAAKPKAGRPKAKKPAAKKATKKSKK